MFFPNVVLKDAMLEDQSGNATPLSLIGISADSVVPDHYERGLPVHYKYMDFALKVINLEDLESNNRKFTLEWVCRPHATGAIYSSPNFPDVNSFCIYSRPDAVIVQVGTGGQGTTICVVPFTKEELGKFNHVAVQFDGAGSKVYINGGRSKTFTAPASYAFGGTFLGVIKDNRRPTAKFIGEISVIAYYGGAVVPINELKFLNTPATTTRGMSLSLLDKDIRDLENLQDLLLVNVTIDGPRVQFSFSNGSKLLVLRPSILTPGRHVTGIRFSQTGSVELVFNDNTTQDIGQIQFAGESGDFEWIPGTGYLVGDSPSNRKYIPVEISNKLTMAILNGINTISIAPDPNALMSFNNKLKLERVTVANEAVLPAMAANVWTPVPFNILSADSLSPSLLSAGKIFLPPGRYYISGVVSNYRGGNSKARVLDVTAGVPIAFGDAAFQTAVGSPANSNFNDFFTLGVASEIEVQYISSTAAAVSAPSATLGLAQSSTAVVTIYKV